MCKIFGAYQPRSINSNLKYNFRSEIEYVRWFFRFHDFNHIFVRLFADNQEMPILESCCPYMERATFQMLKPSILYWFSSADNILEEGPRKSTKYLYDFISIDGRLDFHLQVTIPLTNHDAKSKLAHDKEVDTLCLTFRFRFGLQLLLAKKIYMGHWTAKHILVSATQHWVLWNSWDFSHPVHQSEYWFLAKFNSHFLVLQMRFKLFAPCFMGSKPDALKRCLSMSAKL